MGLSSKQVYEDTFNWPQVDGLEILTAEAARGAERKNAAPTRCPRCDSTNTKFCYYNNYSRSQPRHFCRACRRHWTAGGTLRNVPVGGGRKNKRRKTTSDAAASSDNPPPTRSAAAPFVGELDDAVLLDDFLQVLHHPGPPPVSAFVDKSDGFGISLPPHSLPFMSEVGTLRSDFDFVFDSAALPFTAATSSSSCSTYSFCGHEGLLMDGSTADAWVQESPVLPDGFWDFYDGATDFSGADLRHQE